MWSKDKNVALGKSVTASDSFEKDGWSRAALDYFRIPPRWFTPPLLSGARLGRLRKEIVAGSPALAASGVNRTVAWASPGPEAALAAAPGQAHGPMAAKKSVKCESCHAISVFDAERVALPLTTALNSLAGSGMLKNSFKPKTRSTLIDDDDLVSHTHG